MGLGVSSKLPLSNRVILSEDREATCDKLEKRIKQSMVLGLAIFEGHLVFH